MNQNLTELVFILDRSGSMHGLEDDTIGGFNRVLEENKAMPGKANVTTILFDSRSQLLHDRLDVQTVRPLGEKDYRPGGMTAMLDAIGLGISKIDAVQRSVSEEHRAAHVQFIIITDGMENASKRYSIRQIRQMIGQHQEEDHWEFLFLGANIDSVQAAGDIGIDADHAIDTFADSAGVSAQYEAVSKANACVRGAAPLACSWRESIEKDRTRRGKK